MKNTARPSPQASNFFDSLFFAPRSLEIGLKPNQNHSILARSAQNSCIPEAEAASIGVLNLFSIPRGPFVLLGDLAVAESEKERMCSIH